MENLIFYVLFGAFVILYIFLTRIVYVHESLPSRIEALRFKLEVELQGKDIEKEWYDKSWAGSEPWSVVAMAHTIAEKNRLGYQQPLHLTTSYYSQVKYLLKRGRLPTAFVFYRQSKLYGLRAHLQRSGESAFREARTTFKKAIELEMIGAPYFMHAAVPVLGMPVKQTACEYLLAANEEISWHLKVAKEAVASGNEPVRPDTRIEKGIIWGKLFWLTKDEAWRTRVLDIPFKSGIKSRIDDHEQLTRIAKLIGFGSADELLANLNPEANRQSVKEAKEEDAKFALNDPKEPPKEEVPEQSASPAAEADKSALTPISGMSRVEPLFPGAGPRAILSGRGPRPAGNPDDSPSTDGDTPGSSSSA